MHPQTGLQRNYPVVLWDPGEPQTRYALFASARIHRSHWRYGRIGNCYHCQPFTQKINREIADESGLTMGSLYNYKKQYKSIHGKRMAYIDEGKGDPIVFLHGNPTSSCLWRNVMPHLEGKGRLIAPDLIGMGDSEKLDNSGPHSDTYVEHRKYMFLINSRCGAASL